MTPSLKLSTARRLSALDEPKTEKRKRSWLKIAIIVAVGLIVYAFGFEKTDVDLTEVRDEQRQLQLFRIVRALAHPDLVTYDSAELLVSTSIFAPCNGDAAAEVGDQVEPYIVVTPSCAAPGEPIRVEGFGFAADAEAGVDFLPDSEFTITISLGRFVTGPDGQFVLETNLPEDRSSENAQQIQALTRVPIGSWTNRQSVWTDSNDNDREDTGVVPASGELAIDVNQGNVDNPGAVAVVDADGDLREFVSIDGDYLPTNGPARGEIPTIIDDLAAITGSNDTVRLVSASVSDEDWKVTLAGPPDSDLSGWEVLVYDLDQTSRFSRTGVGDLFAQSPRISQNGLETWDKIVETVFLALLATTVGTILAVPLSFLAARNLMRDISTTAINLSLTLLALPIGAVLGSQVAKAAQSLVGGNTGLHWILVAALPIVAWLLLGRTVSVNEDESSPRIRNAVYSAVGLGAFLWLAAASALAVTAGDWLESRLGWFGFMGRFVGSLGEIGEVSLGLLGALVGAGVLASLASRFGYLIRTKLPETALRAATVVAAAAAGAMWGVILGAVVDWFYAIEIDAYTTTIPATIGAIGAVAIALRSFKNASVSVGLLAYYMARSVFNALRSIEPLVMGIVFVVWVGFGPFAGSLALALHTTASLAKLYSEQVESIDSGPLEAIRATGATRLQTVVYGVIPQIVPPYISFTMYRWDINVRMSTILGFVGGGGIGFLLQQNINLLNYEKAAAQMLAIGIIVASMDYISARLRERLV